MLTQLRKRLAQIADEITPAVRISIDQYLRRSSLSRTVVNDSRVTRKEVLDRNISSEYKSIGSPTSFPIST